jgi:hypothetical protein
MSEYRGDFEAGGEQSLDADTAKIVVRKNDSLHAVLSPS